MRTGGAIRTRLAVALGRLGDHATDVPTALESARGAGPATADLYFSVGQDLRLAGYTSTAIRVLASGHGYYPDHLAITNALAWYLATAPAAELRDPARALELARRASQLANGIAPYVLDTEAAALASGGRYAEAIEMATAASNLARQQHDSTLALEIEARRRLYRGGKSFVER